jgi:hypothetical protein
VGGIGSILAIWVGRFSAALLFFAGASHLWPPPPPLDQEIHTMFLSVAAMVPLTIGEFIAFYVGMLEVTPKNTKGLRQAKELQHETFSVLHEGADAIRKLLKSTTWRGSSEQQSKVNHEHHTEN